MGSLSAMSSLTRVIAIHGDELQQEYAEQVPESIREAFSAVALNNNIDHIEVNWVFQDGNSLPGPSIDIDTLADRFPDCDVGY